ncbi:MAG: hypothetical protein M3P85_16890 [Actinomycetota bacterium]|nr:hypothetical protein [Actinomycetota bacterium]
MDRVERLGATVIAHGHGPVITGANVPEAHRKIRRVAGGEATPLPTQADLDTLLAQLGAVPQLAA